MRWVTDFVEERLPPKGHNSSSVKKLSALPCSQEPALKRILSPTNPAHVRRPYFVKVNFNAIHLSLTWPRLSRYYDENFVWFLFCHVHSARPTNLILLDLITLNSI